MPQARKVTGASGRRARTAKRPANPSRRASGVKREVRAVIVVALAVLVLLTLNSGATGVVGRDLAFGLKWLLGTETTVAALLVIIFLNLRSLLGQAHLAVAKRWGLLLVWLALAAGVSVPVLLERGPAGDLGITAALQLARTGEGGGIVGGLLGVALLRVLERVGTEVALGGMVLAGVVFLTEAHTRQAFVRGVAAVFLIAWRGLGWVAVSLAGLVVFLARGVVSFFTVGPGEEETPAPPRKPARVAPQEPRPRPPFAFPSFGFGSPQGRREAPPETQPATAAVPPSGPASRPIPELEPVSGPEPQVSPSDEPAAPAIRSYSPPVSEERAGLEDEGPLPGAVLHGAQLALLSGQTMCQLPPLSLLAEPAAPTKTKPVHNLADQGRLLEETLDSFGVKAKVVQIDQGPVVTRFELQPAAGVKVSRIVSLADDIALSLAAADVRIEAPIPGKAAVGIEVPNKETAVVHLREILSAPEFSSPKIRLPLAFGKDIAGVPIVADLVNMPHLLIAGATGSGKSVCINTLIASVLYRLRPNEVKLLMVDPKRVELTVYDGIPHLLAPVVTDPKKAAAALKWVVEEMEKRYELFAASGVRNIEAYNALILKASAEMAAAGPPAADGGEGEEEPAASVERPLPCVIVVIDELADLMMVAAADVEDSICRLAQMARAAGIHLVIATQRPSVDVITGLIKANIPSRVAFAVSSQVDSRTILDMAGAERLLGKGDMLFCPVGAVKPQRVQGAYMNDREVEALVTFWKRQGRPEYQANLAPTEVRVEGEPGDDELYDDAVKLVTSTGSASISMVQRRFRIGYARAARLIDMMELAGVVGPYQGSKPREVLVSPGEEE